MLDLALFNQAIKARGENYDDAAKVMGINKVTLYRKLKGDSDFYRKEIDAFCFHYQVNPGEMFFAVAVS